MMKQLILLGSLLSGCTYTAAVTQTNVPAQRDQQVSVDIKRLVFFATGDTDEVQALTQKLQKKCPNGRVLGIMTKDIRTMYFLFFVWEREVVATGYCVRDKNSDTAEEPTSQPQLPGMQLVLREESL